MAPLPGVTSNAEFQHRSAAALYGVGAVISFAVALLPHPAQASESGFIAMGIVAAAAAAVFRGRAGRLPAWALPVCTAAGTVLISLGVYFSGEQRGAPAADNEMLYLLVAIFAAYFFDRRQAVMQFALIAVAYFVVLAFAAPSSIFVARWAETVGTLTIAGLLVQLLRDRVGELVARLADAARTDPLTGLCNRRGFEDLMRVEVERARRAGSPLGVLVCDVDHFKRVNDRLGHAAGDEALVGIGQILTYGKRQIDAVARTGGEEFTVVLPDTDSHGAYVVAERLRTMLERRFSDQSVPLTLSVGVAAFPAHAATADALLGAADQALYAAKELGRNRSVIFNDEIAGLAPTGGEGEAHLATLVSLAEALDLRDTGTTDHCQTVSRYCALIGSELGLSAHRVERLRIAGIVHDVGKIELRGSILRNPGPLSAAEWAEMRRHPEIGAQILGSRKFDDIRAWVVAHHERLDGRGYPNGLAGREIPLEARILAVADAYEAMTADRAYRPALGPERARAELNRAAGTQFDPRVVDALLTGLDREAAGRVAPTAAPVR